MTVTLAVLGAACSPPGADTPAPSAAANDSAIVGRPGPLATATPSTEAPAAAATGLPEAAARAALDTYIDSLTSQTFGRAMSVSVGAARRMALVRLVQAEHNRIRGGTTTVELVERGFTAGRVRANRVTFRGNAVLRSAVTGTAGSPVPAPSVRRIADPVVVNDGKRWLVSSFAWEGEATVAYEGGQTVALGGVEFRLEGALAFGDVVGVVVLLVADGTRSVRVDGDRLRLGNEDAASVFRTLIGGQPGFLYMTYPRTRAAPRSWRTTVVIDDGEPMEIVLAF